MLLFDRRLNRGKCMQYGGLDAAVMSGIDSPSQATYPCSVPGPGSRSKRFSVAKPSGAVRPGCKLGVSLLLPPSLHYLGTLRDVFLFRQGSWV